MDLTTENILLIGSLLILISIFTTKTLSKFGIPTLILFLGIGMLAGSEGIGKINFNNPQITQFIGVVSLNFILFSGGFDTDWKKVKPVLKQGLTLSTVGVLLTALGVGLFVWYITDLTIYESFLLGSIVSSTDVAAVFSILRHNKLSLKNNIRPTLELESGSNDPMAYVLTIAFLSLVVNQDQSFISIIPLFFKQMILGAVLGFLFGKASLFIINKIRLSIEGLYPVLMIALMFTTFSITDFIGGNGFLAIYIAAVYLGNRNLLQKRTILKMYDGQAWFMQIVLFLTLGLLVFPSHILPVMGIGIMVSLFLILVARPIGVFIALMPFRKINMRSKLYISWVGLRGAVPIVFTTYPLLAGVANAGMIFNIVFFISISSILIQGTTLSPVAKWLGLVSSSEDEIVTVQTEEEGFEIPKTLMKEFPIVPNCFAVGKQIVDINFPKNTIVAMINRDGKHLIPNGSTKIERNDTLIVVSDNKDDLSDVEISLKGKR